MKIPKAIEQLIKEVFNNKPIKLGEWIRLVELPDGSYLCENAKSRIVSNFYLN